MTVIILDVHVYEALRNNRHAGYKDIIKMVWIVYLVCNKTDNVRVT